MKKKDLQEYDVVSLVESLGPALPQGTMGVILLALDKNQKHYEVEFFNDKNEKIEVTTASRHQLKLVERP